jgi:regulator of sirC expression with transglutaminase-like and TPR domain
MAAPDLELFAHLVGGPEAEIDLDQAALLLAEPEYPGLDIPHYLGVLDEIGAQARRLVARVHPGVAAARALCDLLHGQLGFRGNLADYYDPRNSFLNEVLERRTGIPITLAVVLTEVARRADVLAQGVSFPGHFLCRIPTEGGIVLIDPFAGRLLDAADLRALHARTTGHEVDPDPSMLQPAGKRQVLSRILANLRAIYGNRRDAARLRGVLERMVVLSPADPELRRELTRLGGEPPPPRRVRVVN